MSTLIRGCLAAVLLASVQGALAAGGKAVYESTCIACHGADGAGTIPGTPDFTKKSGPLSKPDAVLLKNMTEGFQSPGSALAMPPKGGNPNLSAEELTAVLQYMRGTFDR